ncbi:hypothetical protein BaRGS_00011276 [Batillaria attramentaria]|uniref:Uncharacterized protein n=1 Tax=Batillaria attramentaria TaxID=370345 RepID=A0ABD0JT22_9CAEN
MAGCMTGGKNKAGKAFLDAFVAKLIKKNIKLLALDFDLTILDIHTYGKWDGPVEKLVPHVRPCMRDLIEMAQSKGVFVCIVTFHRQMDLIQELLRLVLPKKVANKVIVQVNTPEILAQMEDEKETFVPTAVAEGLGKEVHIKNVVRQLRDSQNVTISPKEILLLDDDEKNVRSAVHFQHYGFIVEENVDYNKFESFERMLM